MRPRRKNWTIPLLNSEQARVLTKLPQTDWKGNLHCDKLHLEIGAGKGDYWIEMAKLYPDDGWIAMEKVETIAGIALKKALETGNSLASMRLINEDASKLNTLFSPHEIDVIHLNFSDPWPKKRHEKRRLTSPVYQSLYTELLTEGGLVIQKTDNVSLFNYSLVAMQAYFNLIDVDVDYRQFPHPEDAMTEYETKFVGLKQPIFRAVYQKKAKV